MTRMAFTKFIRVLVALAVFSPGAGAIAEPRHGIAMYGDPVLPPDFVSLPYVNANAPQGGKIRMGERGGFDSFNPYILKGRAPWGVRVHVYESLMGRNWDEPFSLYGLLAESIETGANREWVEFTLRPEARFSDGSPVTVEDVLWSMQTLADEGVPRYATAWEKITKAEQTGPRSLRLTFTEIDRELPLILGLRPILKKASFEGRDFQESGLELPIGSGPYVVGDFETNRFVTFKKNPDYWGADLAFNRGQNNLDEITYEYFQDSSVIFEAFRGGDLSIYREPSAQDWETRYTFPAVEDGRIVKSVIPHGRPSGMQGFVFNTRRAIFADWRVRDALIHAFNFEFINQVMNEGRNPRATSYFSNSELGMEPGPAKGRVRELLMPFADQLPKEALTGYALPQSDGDLRNRKNLRIATRRLKEAGWTVGEDGVLRNQDGAPFRFEIMLRSSENEAIANLYRDALTRLGIEVTLSLVDNAQHLKRRQSYDFDMMFNLWSLSLSPGNEQTLYWGSAGVTRENTRNYMGMNVPAAEAMISEILTSTDRADFVAAAQALDRILISGRYVIPIWFSNVSLLAHEATLKYPEKLPVYGDWIGFLPDVWWRED